MKDSKSVIMNFCKKNKLAILAYGIVFCIMLAVFMTVGIYPFGEKTVVIIDSFHSYAPSMVEFKEMLLNGENITFSWKGALGITFAFNLQLLLSPYILIVFLMPSKLIYESFALMLLLKIPSAAVTFYIFGRYKFKRDDLSMTLFAILYALNTYVTAFYWNIMWLDGVILLPLLAIAIEKLVREKKSLMYTVVLALSIFTNYLTGFFLCGFSLAYFIALLVLEKMDKDSTKSAAYQFITRSLLAGGMCALILIPTIFSLRDTSYVGASFPELIKLNYNQLRYVASHFWGMEPSVMTYSSKDAPNVFCGILTLVLLPVFYFNKAIKRREKIVYSVMLFVLWTGFSINVVDFVFNGFHFAANMPHRFSFIYAFLLLVMAYKALINLENVNIKFLLFGIPIYIAMVVTLFFVYPAGNKLKPAQMSLEMMVVNIVLLLLFAALVFLFNKVSEIRVRRALTLALLCIVVLEMFGSAYRNFSYANDSQRENGVKYYEEMMEVSDFLSDESALYRADFKHYSALSEGRRYGYNSINTFTTHSDAITDFLDSIGVCAGVTAIRLSNPTPLVSSILGVKYLFNRDGLMPKGFSIYEYKQQYGNIYLYQNPYVLPLGFVVRPDILAWDIESSEDVYEVQDSFVNNALGAELNMFDRVDFETLSYDLLKIAPTGAYQDFSIELNEDITPDMVPTVTLTFKPQKEGFMNIHLRTELATWATLWVNDHNLLGQSYSTPATSLDAGWVRPGDVITVVIKMNKKDISDEEEFVRFGKLSIHAAVMDQSKYVAAITAMRQQPLNVTYYDNTTIRGTVTALSDDGILYTSIPYDSGWRVFVDGKEKNVLKIGTAMIGVRVGEGEHNIEFKYEIKGLTQGIVVSLICLLIILYVTLMPRLKKRKQTKDEKQKEDSPL